MKTQITLAAFLPLFFLSISGLPAAAQGSLTPPGPPAQLMKSLDQIEPRTPISSVPITLTNSGSYYLTTNVTGTSGLSGITISTNNVTVDLNGFAMLGVPGAQYAVAFLNSQTNVIIRNGIMNGWRMGVHETTGNSRNVVIDGLTIFGSATDGILFDGFSVVRNCLSVSNGAIGISLSGGDVTGCTAAYNINSGIEAGPGSVRNCWSGFNGNYGIEISGGIVADCWVQNNFWSGIQVPTAGCTIIGNTCYANNGSGLSAYAGIRLEGNSNHVEGNHVSSSGFAGISVNSALGNNNIIIKNNVSGNGGNNYLVPGTQILGPLITNTISGFITNSNPWGNLSF